MTPEEMIKRYATDPEELSPEMRAKTDDASRKLREKQARGEYATPKTGDNFPIGLDDNFEPFPLTGQDQDTGRGDQTQQ